MSVALTWHMRGPDDAPVLVLLNSLGTSAALWGPQLGRLTEHFRVVTIDHRGHGGSPAAPNGEPSTIADLSRDVLVAIDAAREAADVPSVHLAGLSLGGMLAMWIAAHHPDLVARLALLCTSAFVPPAQSWVQRAATVRSEGLGAIAPAVCSRWITAGLADRDPDLVDGLQELLTSTDAESYAQCCEAIAGMDQRLDLARITAPTLVVMGAQDLAIPPAHGEALAAAITGSALHVLSPAAHLATLEASGAITELLLDHLRPAPSLARGYATRREVLGDTHVDAAIGATTSFSAPFQELITRYAWGDVWSRPGLSRRERSMVTLAALVSLGAEHEIAMHVRAAVRNGVREAAIAEVLLHTALYAGLPRANRAFAIATQALLEAAGDHPAGTDPGPG